jgi:hypothetical protein
MATISVLVTLTVAAVRIVAPLAREARLITIVWLALRGTRPGQRAEIIRALTGRPGLVDGSPPKRALATAAAQRAGTAAISGDRVREEHSAGDSGKVANGP